MELLMVLTVLLNLKPLNGIGSQHPPNINVVSKLIKFFEFENRILLFVILYYFIIYEILL